MLYIVTAVSVLGGVVFFFLARGDVQDWARDEQVCIPIEPGSPDERNISGDVHPIESVRVVSERLLPTQDENGSEERSDHFPRNT